MLRFLATLTGIVVVVWALSLLAAPDVPPLEGHDITPGDPAWVEWIGAPLALVDRDDTKAAAKERGDPDEDREDERERTEQKGEGKKKGLGKGKGERGRK